MFALQTGCATAPPTQEMSDARQNLEAARTVGADKHAPQMLNNAQQLLTQAENDLQSGNYKAAQKDAVAAHQAAHQATRQALAIAQAKPQTKQEPAAAVVTPEAKPQVIEQRSREPIMPGHYRVESKDSLWQIAAKPEIYGDARLWPLLLKANGNLIKNPRLIKPGITLRIERLPSAEQIEAALNFSRTHSNAPLKASNTSSLRHSGLR